MARMSCQDGPTAVLREMQSSQEKTLKKTVATSGHIPTSPTCAVSSSDMRAFCGSVSFRREAHHYSA